jgi:hypothetical protein
MCGDGVAIAHLEKISGKPELANVKRPRSPFTMNSVKRRCGKIRAQY